MECVTSLLFLRRARVRLRALGKDFHPECFICEVGTFSYYYIIQDCGLVLVPGVRGKECWPIRQNILCYTIFNSIIPLHTVYRCNQRRQDKRESD